MLPRTNLLGAMVAIALYSLYISLFIFRLLGKPQLGHLLTSVQFLTVVPMGYLLLRAPQLERPVLYYVQIGLMLVFLIVELLLDYILKIDFRQTRWAAISYAVFFFAATGGILGVAATGGRKLTILAVALFWVMAVLAFVQRAVTGM